MLHARTLSLALLTTAAIGVAGCGGDDSGGGGDDDSQIRDTVTNYAAAIAEKDGDKACDFLTKSAREQVEAAGKAMDAGDCGEVLEQATEQASDEEREQLKDVEVVSVKVDGDRATVQVKAGDDTGDPSTLVKEDGEWKIAVDQDTGTETAKAAPATVASP
jgi:hypothetical protein